MARLDHFEYINGRKTHLLSACRASKWSAMEKPLTTFIVALREHLSKLRPDADCSIRIFGFQEDPKKDLVAIYLTYKPEIEKEFLKTIQQNVTFQ